MAFRLLALAVPDPVKTEIKIAYPERDIMECSLQPRSQGRSTTMEAEKRDPGNEVVFIGGHSFQ